MDAVHESDQPIDIGICPTHNRVFQCYCTQCYCMICPSCLMFDAHKGHHVCKIEEGVKDIRGRINGAAKEGALKFQKTQSVLLDVRHAKLSLEQNMDLIVKSAQKYFDDLILTIKNRKAKFLQQIHLHIEQQLALISQLQGQWLEKQELSQKILKLQASTDDIKLMEEAQLIILGLQKLNQPTDYRQLKLIENIENEFIIGKHKFKNQQLTDALKEYLKKGRIIVNRIKC